MSTTSTRDDFDRLAARATPGTFERKLGVGGVLAALGLARTSVQCGRFQLVDKLGEGAMGVVYRAFDPELRRHVALKILHDAPERGVHDRLQREARALARQQHPNIVQVLAFGRDQGRTFIAMELVEGMTLAQWSLAHPPGAPGRLAQAASHLRAAAEGLVAAHAVGLVHRDVKPANILVRDDGAVKLADFGLARADASVLTEPRTAMERPTADSADATGFTRTGMIVGTPRYMAPEQHMGRPGDARCDQFSFAVTAWEVLGGAPPFTGRTMPDLLEAICSARLEQSSSVTIPPALRRVLRRAMAAEPDERFGSMRALLDAWSRALRPRRGVMLGVAVVVAGIGAASIPLAFDSADACDGRATIEAFEGVWNAERRRGIDTALRDTGAAWGPTTAQRIDDALASYGQHWVEADIAACEGASAGDEAAARALDERSACREHAFATADALLDRLESAPRRVAERALAAVEALPGASRCGARDEHETSAIAASLRRRLARVQADFLAGEHATALVAARTLADAARDAGLAALQSEALHVAALAGGELEDPATLELNIEAYTLAMEHDIAALAFAPALGAAVWLAGRGDTETARMWLRHASAAAARGEASPVHEAGLARTECIILDEEGLLDAALARCSEGLDVLAHGGGPAPALRAKIRTRIANLYQALARHHEALALATTLRDEAEAELGPWHPRTGGLTMNVGTAAHRTKDFALAEASFLRAADIFRAAYGPEHKWVVSAHMNLGALRHSQDDDVGAEAALRQALAATGGREDAATARVLHNLAETRRRMGRPDEALVLLQRVQVIEDEVLERGHLQTASTHHTRANVYLDLGRLQDAERELLAARELWRRSGRAVHDALDLSLARLERLQRASAAGTR